MDTLTRRMALSVLACGAGAFVAPAVAASVSQAGVQPNPWKPTGAEDLGASQQLYADMERAGVHAEILGRLDESIAESLKSQLLTYAGKDPALLAVLAFIKATSEPESEEIEDNPCNNTLYEAPISEIEDDLLCFLQRGEPPVFYYDKPEGIAEMERKEITPERVELERRYWVEAHRAQARELYRFLALVP